MYILRIANLAKRKILMKINDSFKNTVSLDLDKTGLDKGKADKKADALHTNTHASDSVTLSKMSAQLQSIEAKMTADNVFDADKVAAIKLAIADGQFRVNSEKVADGLIETVKDLLYTKKG
jgi:negative regulator of flagellin synthesis FlgM